MAWRASVSSQPFFSRIHLGTFQDIAKKHIMNDDPGDGEFFSVVLAKFDHPLGNPILDPDTYKQDGVNFLRFYLAGYIAHIKVDDKRTPPLFSKFALSEGRPLYILLRDFTKSKELNLMKALIVNHR